MSHGGYKWLSQEEIKHFDENSISENSSNGYIYIYILEVHLEYPDELHNFHDDYPLAPEKHEISNGMLSNYCSIIADKYGIKMNAVKKLVPNWGNKSKYVVHYRNL